MANIYYDKDADLNLLNGKKIAIIGFGSQGHAHALNLRESGADVRVGLYPGSKSWAKAEAQGLRVLTADQACAEADVIMLLAPDTSQAQIYREVIAPHLTAGKTLMFGHGFNIRYGQIIPPADVDVSMVAPKGPGHRVREVLRRGAGRAGADRRLSGRLGPGQAERPRLRQRHRRHAGGHPRDDLQGGDRDRSLRRAGGAVRRRRARW